MSSLSDKQAAYAEWRARMRSGVEANKVIDLTGEAESTDELGPEWSTDSLFVGSVDEDEAEAQA